MMDGAQIRIAWLCLIWMMVWEDNRWPDSWFDFDLGGEG